MNRIFDRKIILEDGTEFYGYGFGAKRDALVELVFNTSMVGYQEILSDPSYTAQAVVMTYPLIGNYGMCNEDYETDRPTISGLVVREFNNEPSNFRAARTLEDVMFQYDIVGIAGVDTRRLARHIRDEGTCKALIVDAQTPSIACLAKMRSTALPTNQVSVVSTKSPWISACANPKHRVVAVDCGIKHNIIRKLNEKGCNVTVVPYDITAEEVMAFRPDGLFLSNGPGDPTDVQPVIEMVRTLRGRLPIFGICLGHQVISLAYGARTFKMKFGHRGGNHPVKNLETGKVEITSQNHSFAVDTESLKGTGLTLTHLNLLDDTAEGVECRADRIFSVQYHPESAPGPQDSTYLFDKFIKMMEESQNA
mgnify:CR=1 FL=1